MPSCFLSLLYVLAAVSSLLLPMPVWAADDYTANAPYAILIDSNSGDVLYEKDADRPIPPASMSKLMTMTLVMEALKAGQLQLDHEFVVSEDAWRRGGAASGGSTMYAELNSRIKISDLMRGAMVQSANDASIIFAENLAGTEAAFAERMTKRGQALGLKNAVFINSTGLPDVGHVMSVRDLSLLARNIILNYPDYYKIYSEREFTWNKITQKNRNPLLVDYPGADGMKTGYTREAGYGLVGSAVRDGRRLIIVIAGLKTIGARKTEAQKLLDWGFRQFKRVDIYKAGDSVSRARVWGGAENWVKLLVLQDVFLSLSAAEMARVETRVVYKGPLLAPVKQGLEVGFLQFMIDGKIVQHSPLVTSISIQETSSMLSRAWDSIMMMAAGG